MVSLTCLRFDRYLWLTRPSLTGSYIVNYSLSVNSIPASLEPPQVEPFGDLHPMLSAAPMDIDSSGELLRTIGETGVAGLADDGSKKQFNRLLLEHVGFFQLSLLDS